MESTIHGKGVVVTISVVSSFCSSLHIVTVSLAKCIFEWREKTSLWCMADVVTYSVDGELQWIQSCRFLLLCDVVRSMRRDRYHRFVSFGASVAGLMGFGVAPRTVFSWIPRRVRSGAADGMWGHRRLSGASRSALCSLCSPAQRSGGWFRLSR